MSFRLKPPDSSDRNPALDVAPTPKSAPHRSGSRQLLFLIRRLDHRSGVSLMRILVAYLATPGGADAVALGARLARSLEADLRSLWSCHRKPSSTRPATMRSY